LARLEARRLEEDDFDHAAEAAALERDGIVFPLPVVSRFLRIWDVIRAVGWESASQLARATFTGWECEFLGEAVAMMSAADRAAEREEMIDLWRPSR